MTTLSHMAAGYLINRTLAAGGLLPIDSLPAVNLASMIFSNLPDLDMVFFRKITDHHRVNSPFHYPFTWWVIFVSVLLWAILSNSFGALPYIYLAIICVLVHFVMDSLGVNAGICWLQPFDKREFSFSPLLPNTSSFKKYAIQHLTHWSMLVEVAIWIFALIVYDTNGVH